ncbi:replisome organizer [Coprococcus sp. AM27-12LB]|nr:replisome organizer [Coprococcus sp. AM27-12LB]
MANKRMFNIKIVDSDAFLDMPLSTQCLYFHLNMRADDDGFIGNPKKIMRMVGCSEDDLKLLIAKRFVLTFENGVIVIKHWKMHNCIQTDRYTPTVYIDEKNMLFIKQNKSYTLDEEKKYIPVSKTETKRNQNGNKMETNRIQSVSADIDIDKDIDLDKDIDICPTDKPQKQKKTAKHKYGEYNNVLLTDTELDKLKDKFPDWEDRIERLSIYIESKGAKYKSHYATILNWARRDGSATNGRVVKTNNTLRNDMNDLDDLF